MAGPSIDKANNNPIDFTANITRYPAAKNTQPDCERPSAPRPEDNTNAKLRLLRHHTAKHKS